jgi:hypothetical protein
MHDFSHMLVSMVLHGIVYSAIWRLMRGLTLPEVLGVAVLAILAVWGWSRMRASRSRDRR